MPSLSLRMPLFFSLHLCIEFYSRCLLGNPLHIQNSRTWEPWYCATTTPMMICRHWDAFFRVHLCWRSLLYAARYNNAPFFYFVQSHVTKFSSLPYMFYAWCTSSPQKIQGKRKEPPRRRTSTKTSWTSGARTSSSLKSYTEMTMLGSLLSFCYDSQGIYRTIT